MEIKLIVASICFLIIGVGLLFGSRLFQLEIAECMSRLENRIKNLEAAND